MKTLKIISKISKASLGAFAVLVFFTFNSSLFGLKHLKRSTLSYDSSDEESEGPTRILFVFDASNSMNAYWSGERKIKLATKLLSQSLSALYGTPDLELGLRAYGHQTKHVEGQQDCDDTELVVPIKKALISLLSKSLVDLELKELRL